MFIDFHTHAFPDTLAPRAIPTLMEKATCQLFMTAPFPGLLQQWMPMA